MQKIRHRIQAEHIRQAIEAFDRGVDHAFSESRDYDLLLRSKRYPPKAIVGIAAEYATGTRLQPSDFSSGIGAGQACRVLHDLGFTIVGKHSDDDVFVKPIFVPGEVYRRRDLHEQFGGQQQGGISTPSGHPIILLITGKSGSQYGYSDGFRDDGTFWYTGEGQVGDMEMVRGNAAVLNHQTSGKALHVFQDLDGGSLQYVSEAEYIDHHTEVAPDRDDNARKAIVFELIMRSTGASADIPAVKATRPREQSSLWNQPLDKLRDAALTDSPSDAPPKERKATVQRRSEAVRVYVLRRAEGTCEGCSNPAPFQTSDGKPYLEPHHTRRLADGGPDHPRWVAALCPNCHARVHYSADGDEYNAVLLQRLGKIDADDGRPHSRFDE